MKVASLFSGIGGLDLGLHQAGHEIILQCECDPGAQQVLRKAFPGVLLVPDICGLERLPKETELVAAGFPCIDVSRAGLRQGLDGPSTGLVRHVFRLLAKARDEQRPVPWVLLENVEALLDRAHGGPPPVSWVVQQLEQLGYNSWAHRIICSAGFGVPNRRRRIFILASMHGDARDVLLGQGLHRCMGSCLQAVGGDCWECFDPDDAVDGEGAASKAAAMLRCSYALDLGNARSAAGVDVVPTFTTSNARMCLLLSNGRFGLLRIEDAERLQGLPPGHTTPCYPVSIPGIRQHRVLSAAKDSDADSQARARFALLGNAVTVQVAEWLGQRLAEPYRFKYNVTDNDLPLPKHQQPPALAERVWQELREVRIDQLRGEGTAGGVAKLLRGSSAAAPADESEEEEAAAAATGADGTAADDAAADADGSDAEALDMEVALQSGDEEDLPAAAAATAVGGVAAAGCQGAQEQKQQQRADRQEGSQEPVSNTPAKAERSAASGDAAAAAAGGGGLGQGQIAVTERYGTARSTSSWPRAAWYMASQGRWGLKQASDNPVKLRFVPLGEFIKKVGPAPSDVALVTYLQRLKEQGWNVDRTERKMLMCGVNTIADAKAEANALSGLLGNAFSGNEAASSIGQLVWAPLPIGNSGNNNSNNSHDNINTSRPLTPPSAGGAATPPAAAATSSRAAVATAAAVAAAGSSVVWWPCEAIDPFKPPLGFDLQPEHKLALSTEERRKHLPAEGANRAKGVSSSNLQHQQQDAPKTPSPMGSLAAGSAAGATDGNPSSSNAAAAAAGEGEAPARRKLLLLWFHTNSFEWRLGEEVLPFNDHKQEFKAAAQALIESGRLPRHQDWKRAYKEAKHCNTIVARAAKLRERQQQLAGLAGPAAAAMAAAHLSSDDGEGGDSSDSDGECDHRAAVAGRAAKQALAVNMKMPRCKVCEACTQNTGSSSRRCLLVRATAAAAAGHAGAQLSVLADKAVGADIEVWWPLDQAWYKGVISGYDKLRVRHTVEYADGDVEIIPLWAPQQRIKLCSQPAQWVAQAARLAERKAERQRNLEAARAATRVAGAAGLTDLSSVPMTDIEQERHDNIQRNRAMMQALMAADTSAAADASIAPAAANTPAAAAAAPPAPRKKRSKPPKPTVKTEKGSQAADEPSKPSAAAAAAAAAGSNDGRGDLADAAAAAAAVVMAAEDELQGVMRTSGLKRTAACVAEFKIKDQMQVLKQQVRLPVVKKRKALSAAGVESGNTAAAAAGGGDSDAEDAEAAE